MSVKMANDTKTKKQKTNSTIILRFIRAILFGRKAQSAYIYLRRLRAKLQEYRFELVEMKEGLARWKGGWVQSTLVIELLWKKVSNFMKTEDFHAEC